MSGKLEYPKTPTLDKMLEVKKQSQTIGEFLEWLTTTEKVALVKWDEDSQYYQIPETNERLLAKFFDVDLNESEKEKRAILEYVKQSQSPVK
jgi:hypothetical protein